jgi:hypothetical protein
VPGPVAAEKTGAGVGAQSLLANTIGDGNTAVGFHSLENLLRRNHNTAVGDYAGSNLNAGSYNAYFGNLGGSGQESHTVRIGWNDQAWRTFIFGIRGVATDYADAVPVLIDSHGQLGTASSSRRFKDEITDMGDASTGLMRLRPVTFRYETDKNPVDQKRQYGLIAEEVAEVVPDLVAHSADGQIETVMYQFLAPMLLNEVQKQQRTIEALRTRLQTETERLEAESVALRGRLEALEARLAAVCGEIKSSHSPTGSKR